MKTKVVLFVLSLTVFVPAVGAYASVLDFETLAHTEEYLSAGSTYTEDGFVLKNTAGNTTLCSRCGERRPPMDTLGRQPFLMTMSTAKPFSP